MTPKQLFAALETEHLLEYVLGGQAWLNANVALHRLQTYLYAARVQQRRIAAAAGRLDRRRVRRRGTLRSDGQAFSAMATEIHFYITCWGVIEQQLTLIRSVTQFPPVGRALRPYGPMFRSYRAMRDRLEHFDDQLVDSPRARPRRIRQDFGNFSKTTFSFGGDTVDIGPQSLAQLNTVVSDVKSALKTHAWQMIAETQPDVAERIVRDVVRDRQLREVIRVHRRQSR